MKRYYLSLSTFAGIVFHAKHWRCRITWEDEKGERQEEDAEHGPEDDRTQRFNTKTTAKRAGLAIAKRLAGDSPYIVTEGSFSIIDPQETLIGPAGLKEQLNVLWVRFENLKGWDAPRAKWPEVQTICDHWTKLLKGKT